MYVKRFVLIKLWNCQFEELYNGIIILLFIIEKLENVKIHAGRFVTTAILLLRLHAQQASWFSDALLPSERRLKV